MNEAVQSAWFYTREGQRLGPVNFAELRVKAAEATLNPRLDMVWKQGMEAWKPAGEVDGLYEKHSVPVVPESLAPAADPYTSPQENEAAETLASEGGWPGARRRSYLFMTIIFPLLLTEGFSYGPPLVAPNLSPEMNSYIAMGAVLVSAILAICYSLMRLVNLGMSRWWFLGNLVPILNLWIGYRCFACPAGYARHKKLDGAGVVLAIIYWLFILLAVLSVVAVIAVLAGAVGDPVLKEQILEAIRDANRGRGGS